MKSSQLSRQPKMSEAHFFTSRNFKLMDMKKNVHFHTRDQLSHYACNQKLWKFISRYQPSIDTRIFDVFNVKKFQQCATNLKYVSEKKLPHREILNTI